MPLCPHRILNIKFTIRILLSNANFNFILFTFYSFIIFIHITFSAALKFCKTCVNSWSRLCPADWTTAMQHLAGLPKSTIAPLQRVQNAAARLVARLGPYNHVTATLKDRHWLPIEQRILFKLCVLMHQVHIGLAPVRSPRVRHCISRRHFTFSSAIHQQSAI